MTTLPGSDKLPIGSGPAADVRKETIMLETLSRHWWAVALRGVADGGRTRGSRAWLFARGIAGILTGSRELRHDPAAAAGHHRPATA